MSERATTLLPELYSLEGQVAVVTGATGVLGGAMARGLARAGARVGVLGRRREKAEAAVQTIEADGGGALALPADVLDPSAAAVIRPRSTASRILALDTLTLILVALLVLYAAANRSSYYMDAAVVLSLVAFVATLVLARYHGERRIF